MISAFQPARLRLARELKAWTQTGLAAQIGATAAAVSQFESGASRPGTTMLDRLSEVLDVPDSFFFLPAPETHEGFFRSLRRTSVTHRRRARALAYVAHDLAEGGPARVCELPLHQVGDVTAGRELFEEIAGRVRDAWNLPAGPITNVVSTLEGRGIVVIRLPLDSADVDAFSLPFRDRPVIVLGSDKNDRARSRFDAAHELGHLVAHSDQVWGIKEVENQAHWFAASFLMPADDIVDELPTHVDWPTLFDLKRKWQVSLAALLMRARTLDRLTPNQYVAAIKTASARGWRRVEPVSLGAPEAPTALHHALVTSPGRRLAKTMPRHVVDALELATATL